MTFFNLWSHHGFGFGHHGGYGHHGHHNDYGHHGFKFGLGCGSSCSSWGACNNGNMFTSVPQQQPTVQLPVQQPIIADNSADDTIDMSFAVNDDAGANDLVLADDSSDLVFGNAVDVDSSGTLADSDAVSIMNSADNNVVADDAALTILAASDASATDTATTDEAIVADEGLMFTTTVDDSASVPVVADDSGLGGEIVTAVPPSDPINAVALTAGDDQYTDVAGVERVDGLEGTDVVGIDTTKAALGLTELADGSISIAVDGTETMQIVNVENIAVNDAALGINADGKWAILDSASGDDVNSLFPVSTFTNVDNPIMTVTGETTDTTVEIDAPTPTPGSTDAGVVIDGEVVYFPVTSGTPPNDDNADDADVVVTPPVTVTPDVPVIPSTPVVVADSGCGWSGWGRWNNWHNSQVNVVNDDNGCGSKSYDYGHGGSSYGGHFGLFSGCGLFGGLFHNVFSSGWSHGGHHDWGCC